MSPPPRTTPLRALPQAAQFQSTPRFGSSSVPRPSQRREPSIEDVEVDERQASLGGSVTGWDEDQDENDDEDEDTDTPGSVGVRRAGLRKGLDLEIDSITSASSSPNAHANAHAHAHGSSPGVWDVRDEDMDSGNEVHDRGEASPLPFVTGDKRAKRRRILDGSVRGGSSISSWSSSWEREREREMEREREGGIGKERAQDGGDITPTGGASIAESESASYVGGSLDDREEDEDDQDSRGGGEEEDEDKNESDDGMHGGGGGRKSRPSHQQPIFQPPPPFKPPDIPDIPPGNNILPMGFSPRRPRGRPYPPGGMAAQLQAWLSEVRGWDGESRPARRMVVGEVRPGPLMYLARGRCEDGQDGQHRQDRQDGQGQVGKGYILAGEGKLTGMRGEERVVVRVGSVVVLEEPVWEVELLGEMWTVVCNWSVES
ncbi:hypothetical protein E4U24_002473 [Claviceps purpurea]|nr:hypothetical protein E4U24_002473 [Claviceps purpurea]